MKIDIVHMPQLTFPAVTVCNHNPVLKSVIMEYPDLKKAVFGSDGDDGDTTQSRRKRGGTDSNKTVRFTDFKNSQLALRHELTHFFFYLNSVCR